MTEKMLLADLFRDFQNGDETSWKQERAYLKKHRAVELAALRESIRAEGIKNPIRLCYFDGRVIDGHHRLIVAEDEGLAEVPVVNAWSD